MGGRGGMSSLVLCLAFLMKSRQDADVHTVTPMQENVEIFRSRVHIIIVPVILHE